MHTNRGRSYGGTAAEGFETSIDNFSSLVIDLNLQLHNIAASWSPDESGTDRRIILIEGSNIPGIIVMVHNSLMV